MYPSFFGGVPRPGPFYSSIGPGWGTGLNQLWKRQAHLPSWDGAGGLLSLLQPQHPRPPLQPEQPTHSPFLALRKAYLAAKNIKSTNPPKITQVIIKAFLSAAPSNVVPVGPAARRPVFFRYFLQAFTPTGSALGFFLSGLQLRKSSHSSTATHISASTCPIPNGTP